MKSFPREKDGGRELEGMPGREPEGRREMQSEVLESPEQKAFAFPLPDQTVLALSVLPHLFFSFLERGISKVVKAMKASPGII